MSENLRNFFYANLKRGYDMKPDLYNKLDSYIKEDIYPFHMPGHKRNKNFLEGISLSMDITEIEGMDNLHNPTSVIKNTQRNLAHVFGAKRSFLLVNGSSSGIIAAIMTVCKEGDYILAARNSHCSFTSAMIYSGAKPIYVMPALTKHGFAGGVCPQSVEAELMKNERIKAVYITSPTYEGIVSDIKEIAAIAHKYNKLLIVDEAHGAHFAFSEYFPDTSLSLGADIVIQSLHKTLPVLTQSAVLHTSIENIDLLEDNLRFIQTTSPSYIFMATVDKCVYDLSNNAEIVKSYTDMLAWFRERVRKASSVQLLDEDITGSFEIKDIDRSKLVFLPNGMKGRELENELRSKYKIQLEMSSAYHAIAMTSLADTEEGFCRLLYALKDIKPNKAEELKKYTYPPTIPEVVYTPREAFRMGKKMVNINESIGMICAETVVAYPPGIPIISRGEVITKEVLEVVVLYKEDDIPLVGLKNKNNIEVLKTN